MNRDPFTKEASAKLAKVSEAGPSEISKIEAKGWGLCTPILTSCWIQAVPKEEANLG